MLAPRLIREPACRPRLPRSRGAVASVWPFRSQRADFGPRAGGRSGVVVPLHVVLLIGAITSIRPARWGNPVVVEIGRHPRPLGRPARGSQTAISDPCTFGPSLVIRCISA